jgi:transcriptional regulator with XRE-family HTH domain
MEDFGPLLRDLRLTANLGLRRFAELIGIKPSNLSDMENGRRHPPSDPEKLREIAETLGLAEDSAEWRCLFDAARRRGDLPADIRHMADRSLVPALLRTIDNLQLGDDDISRLIRDIETAPRTIERRLSDASAIPRDATCRGSKPAEAAAGAD